MSSAVARHSLHKQGGHVWCVVVPYSPVVIGNVTFREDPSPGVASGAQVDANDTIVRYLEHRLVVHVHKVQ